MSDNTFDLWDIYDSLKKEFSNSEDENKSICQCGSNNIVEIDSMNICSNCNAIIDKTLDNTAEWRYYGSDDNRDGDPSRCGMPINNLLPKSSMGSVIGGTKSNSIDMKRIRMY